MALTDMAASETGPDTATADRIHALRRWLGNSGIVIGGGLFLLILFATLVGPWLVPHDPFDQSLVQRLHPPVWSGGTAAHPLGTDHLGRD